MNALFERVLLGSDADKNEASGVWIGIDLGTSNSACAVWDSTRGSPKWIRLPSSIAPLETNSSKWGRLVPSVVKLPNPSATTNTSQSSEPLLPKVGAAALEEPNGTLIRSVKRLLGRRKLSDFDTEWIESLPYRLVETPSDDSADDAGESQIQIQVTPYNETDCEQTTEPLLLTPLQVLAIILKGIREAAQIYLNKYAARKHLDVPGGAKNQIRNVVIGVPAHYSKRHLALVQEAGKLAGFEGQIRTCLESTAAAIAYGHSLQETSQDANIMVIDMGGGTSDITIASKKPNKPQDTIVLGPNGEEDLAQNDHAAYNVLVTEGEERLGGDDIDEAIMNYALTQFDKVASDLSPSSIRDLSTSCRSAKESLCALDPAERSDSETIQLVLSNKKTMECTLSQKQFEDLLIPWLTQARQLIARAKRDLEWISKGSPSDISEVVLVGGTTRVPAIRRMIQEEFPKIELSTSLNPMSSVAQGLAIQAAILSKEVPLHQLRSAPMLDCVPHAIGVLQHHGTDPSGNFVELIRRNQALPAQGTATFTLADKFQRGVTIHAVEQIAGGESSGIYEPMAKEPFTFLLRRLSADELAGMSSRSIQVGMKVDTDGKFIVSIFDALDPEHVRKRARYEQRQQDDSNGSDTVGELGYISDLVFAEAGITSEQVLLFGLLVVCLIMYIGVKIAFSDLEESTTTVMEDL